MAKRLGYFGRRAGGSFTKRIVTDRSTWSRPGGRLTLWRNRPLARIFLFLRHFYPARPGLFGISPRPSRPRSEKGHDIACSPILGRHRSARLVLGSALIVGASILTARAEDAGKRDFPATLVVEEPQVETEIAPQVATWGSGSGRRTDLRSDLSVKLAAPLSFVVQPAYTVLRPGGQGFQDVAVGLKYQFVANADHEFVLSAGLSSTVGGTGSPLVGADTFSTLIPTLYFGRGAGDLPDALDWARPFAVTAQIAFEAPTQARSRDVSSGVGEGPSVQSNPYAISLQGSFQYSLPYRAENGSGAPVPTLLKRLIPLVEYDFELPVANNGAHVPVTGTVNPGVLWDDGDITLGLEALIPINRASGTHPGARLQLSYSFKTPWPLIGHVPD